MASDLSHRILAGQGRRPADLVVRNARLLDLVTGGVETTDIAIVGDRIVGTHGRYEGERVIEAEGRFAVPGFIDTHLHIESSLVSPLEFDRACCRTASPRCSAIRTRSPTSWARRASPISPPVRRRA